MSRKIQRKTPITVTMEAQLWAALLEHLENGRAIHAVELEWITKAIRDGATQVSERRTVTK